MLLLLEVVLIRGKHRLLLLLARRHPDRQLTDSVNLQLVRACGQAAWCLVLLEVLRLLEVLLLAAAGVRGKWLLAASGRRLVGDIVVHPVEPNLVLDLLALLLRHPPELDRVPGHAQGHALLQSTVLAPVPVYPIHYTVLLSGTLVIYNRRLAAPEEALTALAGDDPIVDARGLVAAHLAGDDLDLG